MSNMNRRLEARYELLDEMPHVTGPVPTRVAGAGALSDPQPVVAQLHVGRRHTDLAGHPGLGRQRALGPPEPVHWAEPHLDARPRPANEGLDKPCFA